MSELNDYAFQGDFGEEPDIIPPHVFPDSVAEAVETLIKAGFEVSLPTERHSRNLNVHKWEGDDSFVVQFCDGGCTEFPTAGAAAKDFVSLAESQVDFESKLPKK